MRDDSRLIELEKTVDDLEECSLRFLAVFRSFVRRAQRSRLMGRDGLSKLGENVVPLFGRKPRKPSGKVGDD